MGKQEAESLHESVTFGGDSATPLWVPSLVCSQLVEKAGDREEMGRLWGAHGVVREMKLSLRGICIYTLHFAMLNVVLMDLGHTRRWHGHCRMGLVL